MGASASSLSAAPPLDSMIKELQTLVNSTQITHYVTDQIFIYLIKQLTVTDFYTLTSPTECNKYVMFLGNRLRSVFMELEIVPSKGAGGTIFFRPLEQLARRETTEEVEDQKSICLYVAYFYIRIFQIYGALALTLIDDARSFVESGVISSSQLNLAGLQDIIGPVGTEVRPSIYRQPTVSLLSSQQSRFQSPSYSDSYSDSDSDSSRRRALYEQQRLQELLRQRQRYGRQLGGAGDSALTALSNTTFPYIIQCMPEKGAQRPREPIPIKRVNGITELISVGYSLALPTTGGSSIFFKMDSPSSRNPLAKSTSGAFYTGLGTNVFKINVGSVPVTNDTNRNIWKLTFKNVKHINRSERDDFLDEEGLRGLLGRDVSLIIYGATDGKYYTDDANTNRVEIQLGAILTLIIKSLREELREADSLDEEEEGGPVRPGAYGSTSTYGSRPRVLDSMKIWSIDERTDVSLRMKKTFDTLSKTRNISFGISRALRLLKASFVPPEWKTSICDKTFLVTADRVSRDGAPGPGSKITSNLGLSALSQLFFDMVMPGNAKIGHTAKGLQEYTNFINSLYKSYNTPYEETLENRVAAQKGIASRAPPYQPRDVPIGTDFNRAMGDTTNKFLESACGNGVTGKEALQPATVGKVWSKVKSLFAEQLRHSAVCGSIFKQLFLFKQEKGKQPTITINPKVLKGGITVLDKINEQARQALMKYYTNCESIFQTGVLLIVESEKGIKEEAAKKKTDEEAAAKEKAYRESGRKLVNEALKITGTGKTNATRKSGLGVPGVPGVPGIKTGGFRTTRKR